MKYRTCNTEATTLALGYCPDCWNLAEDIANSRTHKKADVLDRLAYLEGVEAGTEENYRKGGSHD